MQNQTESRAGAHVTPTGDRQDGDVLTQEAMRSMYFKLLLKKAEEGDGGDADLFGRIERLVGLESGKEEDRGRKTAGSTPATPPGPATRERGSSLHPGDLAAPGGSIRWPGADPWAFLLLPVYYVASRCRRRRSQGVGSTAVATETRRVLRPRERGRFMLESALSSMLAASRRPGTT